MNFPRTVDQRVWAFLFVVGVTALILFHYHDRFWWPPDEGAYAHVAERILDGEVLHRDVQDLHMGYVNFANALAMELFGRELVSLRYPVAALTFMQACLVFFVFAGHGATTATVAAISITALSFVQFLNPTAHWYCLFLFILLICLLTWYPRDSKLRLECIGFLVATIFLFRQLTGAIVAVGVMTYLLAEAPGIVACRRFAARTVLVIMAVGLLAYVLSRGDLSAMLLFGMWPLGLMAVVWRTTLASNTYTLRLLTRLGLGGFLGVLPLVSYHAYHGTILLWLDDTIVASFGLTQLDFMDRSVYVALALAGLLQAGSLHSLAEIINGLFWFGLPLLAAINGSVVLRRSAQHFGKGRPIAPLPCLSVFYALVSIHYQIPIYLFYSVGVSMLSLLWLNPAASGTERWRSFPFGLAVVTATIALYYHAAQPLSRGLLGIIRGETEALVSSDEIPRSGLYVTTNDIARYRWLIGLIHAEVAPGETILAIPLNPELYFLSGRKNLFRFYNTAFGIASAADLELAVETIEQSPPRLVFFDPNNKYNTLWSSKLMEAIVQRYKFFERRDGLEIYRYPE